MMKLLRFLILLMMCHTSVSAQHIFDAARTNDTALIRQSIVDGINVDTVNTKGYTPLILAVYNNSFEAAKLLLALNANPNHQDLSGNTALMGAIFRGYQQMADLLLKNNALVDLQNFNGASALFFAATFGQYEIAESLLRHGANRALTDNKGQTPLDYAKIQEHERLIELLSQAK